MAVTRDHAGCAAARPSWPGLRVFLRLHRQRRALARLETHLLDDIGLSPDEAVAEARRPVWDVPAHWLSR